MLDRVELARQVMSSRRPNVPSARQPCVFWLHMHAIIPKSTPRYASPRKSKLEGINTLHLMILTQTPEPRSHWYGILTRLSIAPRQVHG